MMDLENEDRVIAKKLAGGHYHVDDDCWYCCFACEDCCNDQRDGTCTCGLEKRIERIFSTLTAARTQEREKALRDCELIAISYYGLDAEIVTHIRALKRGN